MTKPTVGLLLFVALCAGAGCADKMAQQAARSASQQVAVLETELAAKIAAENRYYEGIERLTVEDLERDRLSRMQRLLTSRSRAFAARNVGATAGEPLAKEVTNYATGFADAWRQQETALQAGIDARRDELGRSRQALAVEAAKLGKLQAKLRALGQSRDGRDLFTFLVRFGRATKQHLDALQDSAANTSE